MDYIILMIVFAVAFAVKGEYQEQIFRNYMTVRSRSWIVDRLLDGKVFSFAIVVMTIWFYMLQNVGVVDGVTVYEVGSFMPLWFGIAWLVAVSPSMGEEMGIFWGSSPYQKWIPEIKKIGVDGFTLFEVREGSIYGFKKGIERGVLGGAAMALATGELSFICFSLLYMPINAIGGFVGTRTKFNGWALNEFLFGAIGFGIPTAIWLSN